MRNLIADNRARRPLHNTNGNDSPDLVRTLTMVTVPCGRLPRSLPREGGELDFARITVLEDRYGVSFHMDWVPELSGIRCLG